MYNLLDKVIITANYSDHPFHIGEEVTIYRVFGDNTYDACGLFGTCWRLFDDEFINTTDISMKQMTDAVIATAKKLCKAQNQVTTLEIKAEVIKTHPNYHWTQAYVSAVMDDAYNAGLFVFTDTMSNGNQHRVYNEVTPVGQTTTGALAKTGIRKVGRPKGSTNKPKATATPKRKVVAVTPTKTIGKTKALELMENNKGHFFTATFVAKKGERTINCQYLKDQTYSKLGYVKVKEAIKAKTQKNAPKKKGATVKDDTIRQINLQTLKTLTIAGNSYKVR